MPRKFDLFTAPGVQRWLDAAHLIGEANALGVTFRPSGTRVAIDMPPELPAPLRMRLEDPEIGALLRRVLSGGRDEDRSAVNFADSLGVTRIVVSARDVGRKSSVPR